MKFRINEEVTEKFPNLIVFIAIISGFQNKLEDLDWLDKYIEEQTRNIRIKFPALEVVREHEFFEPYLKVFDETGIDSNRILPTHLALIKRLIEGSDFPRINPIVDLYNAVSLEFLTPFGGEDLDTVYGDFYLTLANGDEQWYGIGENKSRPPKQGELVWRDSFDVSTKSLNWRQCDRTKITDNSTNGYFIMDGFENVNSQNIQNAADKFIRLATENFGGSPELIKLEKANPDIEISHKSKNPEEISEQKVTKSKTKIRKSIFKHSEVDLSNSLVEPTSIKTTLKELLSIALKEEIQEEVLEIEHPNNENFGDFSTNIALKLSKRFGQNSREIAIKFNSIIKNNDDLMNMLEKVEIAGPGFINLHLKKEELIAEIFKIIELDNDYLKVSANNKTWRLDHTSPNPNKAMHLGHLRNNVLSMALYHTWTNLGVNVILECMNNNRGIAIAKLMWGYLKFARKDGLENPDINYWYENQDEWLTPESAKLRPDIFMDQLYTKGSTDAKDPESLKIVKQLVVDWEAEDKVNRALWDTVLNFVYAGQKITLSRLGNKWDVIWNESDHYEKGRDYVFEGVKDGIFKESEGAIVSDFSDYGVPDTVFVKSDGTTLYLTQDIALNYLKMSSDDPDKLFWVVGPEQSLSFQQLFIATEQLGIAKKEDLIHLAYGYMSIKGQGKMSSRLGNVLYIDDLLDLVKSEISSKFTSENLTDQEKDDISEKLAVGAVKYSILKVARMTDTAFDLEKSIALDGDSGPYINYTYARGLSILEKAKGFEFRTLSVNDIHLDSKEEIDLLRILHKLPEVAYVSGVKVSPNLVAEYLFQLAQTFNTFYKQNPVLSADNEEVKNSRLALVTATLKVFEIGAELLGITLVTKM